MSRILRRPMFRGGRVDSRGTGITSGLSYAKGGSVEPQAMYGVGNNANRDAMGREKHAQFKPIEPQSVIDAKKLGILLTPEYLDQKFRKNYYLDDEVEYIPDPASLGMQGMISDTYGLGVEGNPVIDEGGILDITRDQILTGDKGGTADQYKEFYKKKFIADNYAKEIEKQKKALEATNDPRLVELMTEQTKNNNNQNNLNIKLDNEPANPEIDKDTIKKYKDMFREAYGSGRGDDVVSMLMNFAGKALKPEATVKSAFGEFFEEEGKRPSKRKQYDEAAATAAINAYIAGEKSMADTKKALAIYDKKLSQATAAENSKTITTRMNEDKGTQRSELKKLVGHTAQFMEEHNPPIPGVPQQIKNEQAEDPALLTEENIGTVFIDTDSKKVFMIIVDSNGQPVKRPLYSG
jgi:hypothetical protein